MIKGLVITPPVIGRISIGKVVEKNGKRIPEKDDQFTITTQVQGKDGWINHPLDAELRQSSENGKLRVIPVRFLFNEPDLNLRAEYSLFDRRSGRPICVGNGETCRRSTGNSIETLPCPSPEGCELAKGGHCKPYGRLNVQIGEDDQLGTFIFRTTGFNSIRSLTARLNYYQAVSGNLLSCLPLALRIRGKSTAMSFYAPIYYVDITTREGMSLEETIQQARVLDQQRRDSGYDQATLDQAAQQGFGNGEFEDTEEEVTEIIEEFFPRLLGDLEVSDAATAQGKPSLTNKLNRKTQNLTETAVQ
ncbi:MAG: hypothetical protein PF483_02950 [Halothiobacillus sp.]|jgi:hypothetical protein|nr:hypothetical protein [Halothiobacillus sp.]